MKGAAAPPVTNIATPPTTIIAVPNYNRMAFYPVIILDIGGSDWGSGAGSGAAGSARPAAS